MCMYLVKYHYKAMGCKTIFDIGLSRIKPQK